MKAHKVLFVLAIIAIFSACNSLKNGNKKFEAGEYDIAIRHYEKSIKKGKDVAYANFQIAECYRLSNRLKEATPYYETALEAGVKDESAQLYYGYALKNNGDYKLAKEHFENYIETATNFEYINNARKELENLKVINHIIENQSNFEVRNLKEINTPAAEYSPFPINDEFFFTSSRGGGKIYKATGTAFTNIYKAPMINGKVDAKKIEALDEIINTANVNEGSVAFTPDGNIMVFARGNSGKRKGAKEVNLYITRYRNGFWTPPVLLPINDPNAWDSTPAFSRDGRVLYFASNREGGFGGIDLYSANMDANGRWGNVRNLGKDINTSGNEMFPYVSQEGILYFSSTGHPGLGGLDIFSAIKKNGIITVENMGVPINSSSDDFGISYFNHKLGFFSSNRPGGEGDDDIYTFIDHSPAKKLVNYFLVGTTVTQTDEGVEVPLPNVKIRFLDSDGNVIGNAVTNKDGKFRFKVDPEENYIIIGDKKDYFTTRKNYSTVGKEVPQEELKDPTTTITFETKVNLNKIVIDKAIVLENIYYDFDKANIREDAAKELDKLVDILKDNPEISIELSSHTDIRGDEEYNQKLSQRRAESAVNYIISKGISKERIKAKGYGKSKPIIPNAKTEEEHEVNRRTEFKVTHIKKEEESKPKADDEDMGFF
jgi:peptidoglycan-associated lipoprotein